jgi:hypothetical protein
MRILGHFFRKEFQGDKAMQAGVVGLINDAHPAPTEFLSDAVMRNGLPDHTREILRPPTGQVNESREFAGVSRA